MPSPPRLVVHWLACSLLATAAVAQAPGEVVPLGLGTSGSRGVPRLELVGSPLVGRPFSLGVRGTAANAVGVLFVSTNEAATPLPTFGAVFHPGAPLVTLPFVADAAGRSPRFLSQTPVDPGLVGATLVAQATVSDPAGTGGAVFTGGVRLRVGDTPSGYLLDQPGLTGFLAEEAVTAVGDLDGDGRDDLLQAVTTGTLSLALEARLARPGGPPESVVSVVWPRALPEDLTVGDFDGDGRLDAVTTFARDRGFEVFLHRGDGLGGFGVAEPIDLGAGAASPWATDAGDWDADGDQDLIVASTSGTFEFYRGLGDGTFAFAFDSTWPSSPFARPYRSQLVDLNLDGLVDVVHAWREGLAVRLASAPGTFGSVQPLGIDGYAHSFVDPYLGLHVADVDGDAVPDVIAGDAVHRGAGDGTFAFAQTLVAPTGTTPLLRDARSADLDGDGRTDLVVAHRDRVDVFLGTPSGTLAFDHGVSLSASWVRLVEFDGDGVQDLATGGFLLRGVGDGSFAPATDLDAGSVESLAAKDLALGDLDADGFEDVLVLRPNAVDVVRRDASGLALHQVLWLGATSPDGARLARLDADRFPDAVLVTKGDGVVRIALGDGAGGLSTPFEVPAGVGVVDVEATDVDGDGAIDLVAADDLGSAVTVLLGAGDGTFAAPLALSVPTPPTSVTSGDLDGDGAVDLVAVLPGSKELAVWRGAGGGAFGTPALHPTVSNPVLVRLADLDGRRGLDAVVLGRWPDPAVDWALPGEVEVRLDLGESTEDVRRVARVLGPLALQLADFDGDGARDLLLVSREHGIAVHPGLGDGLFGPPRRSHLGVPFALGLGDHDRDLLPDLVVLGGALRSVPNRLLR